MWSLFQHSEAKPRSPLRTRWRVWAPSLSFGAAKASSDREGRPSRQGQGLWGHSALGSMSLFFLYFLALILKQPQPRKTRELRPSKARPAPCGGSAWKERQRLPCTSRVDPPGRACGEGSGGEAEKGIPSLCALSLWGGLWKPGSVDAAHVLRAELCEDQWPRAEGDSIIAKALVTK